MQNNIGFEIDQYLKSFVSSSSKSIGGYSKYNNFLPIFLGARVRIRRPRHLDKVSSLV